MCRSRDLAPPLGETVLCREEGEAARLYVPGTTSLQASIGRW